MTVQTTSPTFPILQEKTRSDIQLVRRMLLLRWSVGKYLTAIAGNYGFKRQQLGFSDDDFFRSAAQLVMANEKNIYKVIFDILEICLGPYETIHYKASRQHDQGASFLQFEPFGDYVEISVPSGPFTQGEMFRQTLANPNQSIKTIRAEHVHYQASTGRLYFQRQRSSPQDSMDFFANLQAVSEISGTTFDILSPSFRLGLERFPLFGTAHFYTPNLLDPLNPAAGTNLETVRFVSPDPYLGRVRLIEPLTLDHPQGDILQVEGGCWEVFDAQPRRINVRIQCKQAIPNTLLGKAFLHGIPYQDHPLEISAFPTQNTVQIQDTYLGPSPTLPINLVLDPEGRSRSPLQVQATAYNATSRIFTLSAPLPSGLSFPRGTTVRWIQNDEVIGGLSQPAPIGSTSLQAVARLENPVGHWVIDPNGPNEEFVFVKSTSYQKRQVTSEITPLSTLVSIDFPLNKIPEGTASFKVRISDTTGTLGILDVSSVFWYDPTGSVPNLHPQLGLAALPAFSTDIQNKPTFLELVEQNTGEVTLSLSRPTNIVHAASERLLRAYGTNPIEAAHPNHIPQANWPNPIPPNTPTPSWGGPYLFEPSKKGPFNEQKAGLVKAQLDVSNDNDPRSYLGSASLAQTYNSNSPEIAPFVGLLPSGAVTVHVLRTNDASTFPTQTQIQSWLADPINNPQALPPQIVLEGEGSFGRTPVYFWGRGNNNTPFQNALFVSGLTRSHQIGTIVSQILYQMKIQILQGSFDNPPPSLDLVNGSLLLDFGHLSSTQIFYSSLEVKTPSNAILHFERGFSPKTPIQSRRINLLDSSLSSPILVRSRSIASPNLTPPFPAAFNFPFYFAGNSALWRIKHLLNITRAAGVQVSLFDQYDQPINI